MYTIYAKIAPGYYRRVGFTSDFEYANDLAINSNIFHVEFRG